MASSSATRTLPTGTLATAVAGAPRLLPSQRLAVWAILVRALVPALLEQSVALERVALGQAVPGQVVPAVSPDLAAAQDPLQPQQTSQWEPWLPSYRGPSPRDWWPLAGIFQFSQDSGAAAPPSTVAPIPPTSSLPPARGELYSSRGSFRGGGFFFRRDESEGPRIHDTQW